MIVLTILVIAFVYFILDYIIPVLKSRRNGSIPGPFPLPIIGNLLLFGKYIHIDFCEMSKTYGEVFAVHVGSSKKIVVGSAKAMKEVLIEKGTHFAGRAHDNIKLSILTMGYKDIVLSDYGPRLKYLRRVFTRGLNLHGFNKKLVENTVKTHADVMLSRLLENSGILMDPTRYIHLSIINVLLHMVFNRELTFNDPLFLDLQRALRLIFGSIRPGLEDIFPWLRYFPNKNINDMSEGVAIRDKMTYKFVQEHRDTYTPDTIRDITDAMLAAEAEELANGGTKMDHKSFMMLIDDIFVAGVETTSITILWIVLFLAKWPEKQAKVREELKDVDFEALETDKSISLPYTFAAIYEAQRLSSVAPLVEHKTTRDTTLCGFDVPKGTPVVLNLYAAMHDENIFKHPDQYIPERWINQDGEYEPNASLSLPFGAGPRGCPGRKLASIVIFIFVTRLVKNFVIEEVDGHENSMEGSSGLTISPQDLKLKFTKITQTYND